MISKRLENLIKNQLTDSLMQVDNHRKDKNKNARFEFCVGTDDKLEADDLPITYNGTVEIKTNEKGRLASMFIEVDVDYE